MVGGRKNTSKLPVIADYILNNTTIHKLNDNYDKASRARFIVLSILGRHKTIYNQRVSKLNTKIRRNYLY